MMLMRTSLLSIVAVALLLGCLAGCDEDKNLAPVLTRADANVDCGYAPVDVQFVAIASGGDRTSDPTGGNEYLNVSWDFGDGSTGNGSVTSHQFTEPDIYEITVTVTDDDGDKVDESLFVEVRSDSLVVTTSADTTVTAGMNSFAAPTLGASNGSVASIAKDGLCFNEILVFNDSVIADDEDRFSPVLEIYNAGDQAVNLDGYMLLADAFDPDRQHTFGNSTTVLPGEFQLVWLDGGDDDAAEPHTFFDLLDEYDGEPADWSGELQLTRNGQSIDIIRLGGQQTDVSFGRVYDGGLDGALELRVNCFACGFDPVLGNYERFEFLWSLDDDAGTVYRGRTPRHTFQVAEAGTHTASVRIFDTQTSVYRTAQVQIEVLAP